MFNRNKLSAAVLATLTAANAPAALGAIEEIVVTATKRPESAQDIPVAVQALSQETMEQVGISNFDDYLLHLPGVSAGGGGPGQRTIYIRGVASSTPNLSTAGVAGLAPNVAFYLDEQPLVQPGRNLDIYAADLERIEVLAGPQGTLFGASSQAGTVRLITNKPDLTRGYATFKSGISSIEDGGASRKFEGMINVPITDKLGLRAVGYLDYQGGWIDNVPGRVDLSQSARFRSADTVRSNGVRVGDARKGSQADADLSDVTFTPANNAGLLEDDFNETSYSGGRMTLRYQANDDWRLTLAHTSQNIETDGVFFADPNLREHKIQRFVDEFMNEHITATNWTLEGRVGMLDMIYTGAYADRSVDQVIDYTDYQYVAQYLPYYVCDPKVAYPDTGNAPRGTCYNPVNFTDSTTSSHVVTHELRFSTDQAKRLRWTFGLFLSDTEIKELNDFTYLGHGELPLAHRFPENRSIMTGYVSDTGAWPESVVFRNDIRRTDKQFGLFGEGSYDFNDLWSLTVGVRHYDVEVDLEGSANATFCNRARGMDVNAFGTDISDLYDGDGEFFFRNSCNINLHRVYSVSEVDDPGIPAVVKGALRAPDKAGSDGIITKISVAFTPNDDMLLYFTRSEGFRPGLLNRPGGQTNSKGDYTVPYEVDTDDLINYEFGWKLDLLNNSLRVNGNIFYADIKNLQTTIFDPSIVNLVFSDNAADAEVVGLEGDVIWVPGVEGLSISAAFSFLDSEITNVHLPTEDVVQGQALAHAPEFQANLRVRYEWGVGSGSTAHVMSYINHSAASYGDVIQPNRIEISGWTMLGVTAGLKKDKWQAEVYIDNLTDEVAATAGNYWFDRERVTYAQPRTLGFRLNYGL